MAILINKLHNEVQAELGLNENQKNAIHELFEEHLRELKSQTSSSNSESADDKADPKKEEMDELREKLEDAKKSGDREGMQEIRERMRQVLRERRMTAMGTTLRFLGKVEEELSDEQTEKFKEMVRRLGIDSGEKSVETLQEFMKAVFSPDIALTEDQKKMVRDKIREALLAMPPDQKDAGDLAEISGPVRDDIMDQLTEGQRVKIEALLKEDPSEKRLLQTRRPGHVKQQHNQTSDTQDKPTKPEP
ncbi:MAG: hypothetical protein AABZ47_03035 [Planctomycetota bacterium]